MDISIVLSYSQQEVVTLNVDDDFMTKDQSCDSLTGPEERKVRKKYKLNPNENIGLIIIGNEDNKKYITIITDQRFVVIGNQGERSKVIRWNNTRSVDYSDGKLVFKSIKNHCTIIPVKRLTENNCDIDDTGKMIVSLIRGRFNI